LAWGFGLAAGLGSCKACHVRRCTWSSCTHDEAVRRGGELSLFRRFGPKRTQNRSLLTCFVVFALQRRQAAQQAIVAQGIIISELEHPKAVAVTKQGNLELYTDVR
jgi:hypothetical protein